MSTDNKEFPGNTPMAMPVEFNDEVQFPITQAVIVRNNPHDRILLINTYQYSRTIRLLITMETFFVFLNLFTTQNVIYMLSLFMLYYGYCGAMHYKRSYITWYMIYLLFNMVVSVYMMLYLVSNSKMLQLNDDYTESQIITGSAFTFVNFIFNIWIIKICNNFKELMVKVEEKQLLSMLTSADSSFLYDSRWDTRYLS